MDLELKEFEEKINNITEQFMSLLNSTENIENSVGNKFEEAPIKFKESIEGPTVFHTGVSNYNTISTTSGIGDSYGNVTGNITGGSTFKLGAEDINFGGIAYSNHSSSEIPKHAVKFDSAEQMDLNRRLESLYDVKRESTPESYTSNNSSIAFSDSNLRKARNMSMGYTENNTCSTFNSNYNNSYSTYNDNYNTNGNYTNDKTSSTLKDKEVNEMANYNGEESNNVFYNFATVPADKALVEKKSWKDVLFMDIPWDTKIDIWGEFKKFCTTQIKITF